MRSGLIKISNILGYDTPEMALAQDEYVVQAFAAQTAQKSLAERIGTRGFHRCFEKLNICPIDHMPKLLTKLLVIVPDEKAR
jgi:hypothetical protein